MARPAHASDETVVFIECSTDDGSLSKGSGVLVSGQGHVLTARHVVPEGSTCRASVGNNSLQLRGIQPSFAAQQMDEDFDAILLEFGTSEGESFEFAQVCPVTEALKGRDLIAKGFHANSFGGPSSTDGILSSSQIDFGGMIETTAMTVNGKSGGPVFLKDTGIIVGIVAGAEFTPLGIVSTYRVLSINAVLRDLDMLSIAQSCGGTGPSGDGDTGPTVQNQWMGHGDLQLAKDEIERGTSRLLRESYNAALGDFELAFEKGSQFIAPLGRGHAYRGQDLLEQAIGEYSLAIEAEPDLYLSYMFRGNAYSAQKRYQQATEDYSKVIELKPDHSDAYNNRGVIHALLRQYDRALEDFSEAIFMNDSVAAYFHNRGLTHQAMEEHGLGKQDFSRIYAVDPEASFANKPVIVECAAPDQC